MTTKNVKSQNVKTHEVLISRRFAFKPLDLPDYDIVKHTVHDWYSGGWNSVRV